MAQLACLRCCLEPECKDKGLLPFSCGGLRDGLKERWRRIKAEFVIELPLLKARWKQVLFGAIFQYCHGMATQLAHRMHKPQAEPLHDIGFEYLPELGKHNAWVSETIFWCLFIPFILWSFSPFVTSRKRFYTAVTYARLLMVLVACQCLRIISFTVTQLPAPNYHCRLGKDTAVREWPEHWWQHIVVDVGRQATHGCGDLIFSSHTTFVLVGCLTYTEYGSLLFMKIVGWLGVAAMSLCIVMSRKHYSVDVVVAWYTVPLMFYAMHRRWTTKRPVQDYWPHRPLLGEEAVELQALDVEDEEDGRGDASGKQPLLPVVAHSRNSSSGNPVHSRSNSRTPSELKNGLGLTAKQLAVKEPLSPPAELAEDPELGQPLRHVPSNHNMRPRNILVITSTGAPQDIELSHRDDSPSRLLGHHSSSYFAPVVAAAAANPAPQRRVN